MRLTNIEIANTLGLSQSTVSRMRSGHRLASTTVLVDIAEKYSADLGLLTTIAARMERKADRTEWIQLLDKIFDDGEEDPNGNPEPEPELESAGAPTPEFSS